MYGFYYFLQIFVLTKTPLNLQLGFASIDSTSVITSGCLRSFPFPFPFPFRFSSSGLSISFAA
jgi:hypothetical protein